MNIDRARPLPRRPLRAWLAAAALATASLLGACAASGDTSAPSTDTPHNATLTTAQRQHITLATIAAAPFHKAIDATGVVDFDNDQATSVLAPFSGPVTQLLVSAGQHVAKGQPLARVNSPDYAAAVGAYAKALVAARNARRLADADRDAALQALLALGADARTLKAIQSGKPLAHVEAVIRAPVAGTVAEKLITPGQLLQAGSTACFTVADLSRMWVMAQVSPVELAAVRLGDPADIDVGGAGVMQGAVDNIGAVVDPDTRAVPVRVRVDNAKGLLKKQMYVRVRIRSRQAERGLLVPVSAVLRDDENLPFVYVAQHDGSFARRRVTLGYRAGDRYQVSAGLKAGEQVVAQGGLFVQFMQSQ
jgi:cobalt-zinc-cadmium efflux system membrane fusion protein